MYFAKVLCFSLMMSTWSENFGSSSKDRRLVLSGRPTKRTDPLVVTDRTQTARMRASWALHS